LPKTDADKELGRVGTCDGERVTLLVLRHLARRVVEGDQVDEAGAGFQVAVAHALGVGDGKGKSDALPEDLGVAREIAFELNMIL